MTYIILTFTIIRNYINISHDYTEARKNICTYPYFLRKRFFLSDLRSIFII